MLGFTRGKVIAYNELELRGLAEDVLGNVIRFSMPFHPYKSPVGEWLCVDPSGCVNTLATWAEETRTTEAATSRAITLELKHE